MAPNKWSFVLLLGLLILGIPDKVKPDSSSEEAKTASVKDCKVHIEKALEQYWEHEEPKHSSILKEKIQNLNPQAIYDDNEVSTGSENKNINDDDDKDDSSKNDGEKSDKDDDDDDNDNDDDDDEDENGEENGVSGSEYLESEESNAQNNDNANTNLTANQDDKKDMGNDDEVGDDNEEEEDNDDLEDDGDENEEQQQNKVSDSDIQKDVQIKVDNVYSENTEQGQSDLEDEGDDDEEESTREAESIPQNTEDNKEDDKVTGETVNAATGMVSEFSEDRPSTEQSEATKVSEEAFPVTLTTPGKEEISDSSSEDQFSDLVSEDNDDDSIENMFEEDDDDASSTLTFRSRDHVDVILGLDETGTEDEEKLAQSIFREIKKIEQMNIKPIEMLYKYTDSTTRVLGDAEIFNKPMLLFLGPWNSGKTSIINYLLGIERTLEALKTGTGSTDVDFTLLTYGDKKQIISGTELAVDWRYAGVQKFGQGFLDHFRSIQLPSILLKKVNIVDTPGILENKKNTERGYAFNDAFQWFIDRADGIYVVLDPTKVDIGSELGSVLDQLKGRDVRFILNKADTIRRSDLMKVVGQLFWNLSPLMSSTEAPIIYAVSLSTRPFHPSAPARFLADQENNFLYDMKETIDKRVENRILYARRHAVRVRNHAKMVDCYLATYYRHKSIFSNKKNIAKQITENPRDYNIFEGVGTMTNVSRYDLPDPIAYKSFFKQHPLYDFKPLASTCSYFRGCPMDKLDAAITHDIPELFAKYKKTKGGSGAIKQEGR